MPKLPLIQNSIPKQNLDKNQRLSIKAWNDYMNVLRVQTNNNTKFLKALDAEVVKAGVYGGGSVGSYFQTPEGVAIIQDAVSSLYIPNTFVVTTGEPDEDYNRSDYGKVLSTFEI